MHLKIVDLSNACRSWKNQFFNTFLFESYATNSKILAKAEKIHFFNTFLIRILKDKSSHKHQDPPKSWKKQNFNTSLMRKNTKILAKAGKNKFSMLFNENFNRKKQPETPTPKAGKTIKISILF